MGYRWYETKGIAPLAVRTRFPAAFGTLVAADVDQFRGKEVEHFRKHLLDEFECRLLAGAVNVVADSPVGPYGVGTSRASEPRIGGQRRQSVSGHFDLGNHFDMTLGGVAHDFADVVLRVEAAVRLAVVHAFPVFVVASDEGFAAFGADLRQPGIFPDLDAPSLVVGQMPVEFIDLVQGEDVDVGLDVLHREEVAAYVEHGSAVGEHGFVADDAGRDLSVADQLLKAPEPVQYRLRGRCRDCDASFRDFQQILFGVESGSQPQRYGVFRCSGRDGRCGSRKGSDGAGENLGGTAQPFIRQDDGCSSGHAERSFRFGD